jgi:hypothetical protein
MSVEPSFSSEVSGIKIDKLLSLYFDLTTKVPIAQKIQDILKAKGNRPEEDFSKVISEVAEANKCTSVEYKRRGKRKILWGLYEGGPERKVTISIRAHYGGSSLAQQLPAGKGSS